jgi:hypothetical protein
MLATVKLGDVVADDQVLGRCMNVDATAALATAGDDAKTVNLGAVIFATDVIFSERVGHYGDAGPGRNVRTFNRPGSCQRSLPNSPPVRVKRQEAAVDNAALDEFEGFFARYGAGRCIIRFKFGGNIGRNRAARAIALQFDPLM